MSILYCGDTTLQSAASYLCGLLSLWQWPYRYVPSHERLIAEHVGPTPGLFIFSDYPAAQIDPLMQELVAAHVRQGAGLVMIGGWESFHGLGGHWDGTPIGDLLPVAISPTDDRVNFDQPTLVRAISDSPTLHSILQGLPWRDRPPTIGGLNKLTPKPGVETLLAGLSFRAKVVETPGWIQATESFVENWLLPPKVKETLVSAAPFRNPSQGDIAFDLAAVYPLLVVGAAGRGRTAAFASDIAPHWVGGFVDWGVSRVAAQAPAGPAVEVGSDYARFWKQLIAWVARHPDSAG
jgi:uncharacterized membrane protein